MAGSVVNRLKIPLAIQPKPRGEYNKIGLVPEVGQSAESDMRMRKSDGRGSPGGESIFRLYGWCRSF